MVVEISDNCTVYVQVTDSHGRIYTKSRYIEVFDRTNPTVKARIDKTLLRVEAEDDLSGASAIYVDGERYGDLVNGTIDIRLKELGKEYADISIQAVDKAGNKSSITTLKNPNYKEKTTEATATQASTTAEAPAGSGSTTTETSGTATGTNITPSSSTTTSATTGTTGGGTSENTTTSGSSADSGSGSSSDTLLFGTFEDTNKQFMSIVTKDGQVFYMIIDHDKPSENVYLLTEATEADLQSFSPEAETPTEEYPEYIGEESKEEIGFVDETPKTPPIDEAPTETKTEEVPSEPAKSSSPGTSVFVIILIALVAGAGYYFKIYKPKKELEDADDLDDFEFEEDDEIIFEE